MKFTYSLLSVALGLANAQYPTTGWEAPGPGDVRAPCPMLNALANHGILPHDGKGISINKTIDALGSALNIDSSLGQFLFEQAVTTNPSPNATTFDLDHLARHNILEHDASLTRPDAEFGDPNVFDEAIYNQTRAYWTGDVITVQMAANARAARLMTSNLTNPDFSLSALGSDFSLGETGAYLTIIGDKVSGTVPKSFVEYLFENERLPQELGWSKATEPFTFDDLASIMARVSSLQHLPQ